MPQAESSVAHLVPENERMGFLPKHFGRRHMLTGEMLVYGWLRNLAPDYHGGYWHYFEIPGGFYMAPAGYETLRIVWPMNWCDRTMSADAAGIVATLYALCELCESTGSSDIAEKYRALNEFALEHPEAGDIRAAID